MADLTQLARDAQDAADEVTLRVVNGEQCVIVKSPPGAGKTTLVIRTAIAAYRLKGMRVAIACQTNSQAMDLAKRILDNYDPSIHIHYFTKTGGVLPHELSSYGDTRITHCEKVNSDLPDNEPVLSIATAAKWQHYNGVPEEGSAEGFRPLTDVLIVDEAWQLKFGNYMRIAPIAPQHLLVGDPGQIDPVVSSDMSLFEGTGVDTHLSAPVVLERRRDDIVTIVKLPATRRLGPATTAIVSPSFYSSQPFESLRSPLHLSYNGQGRTGEVWKRFDGDTEIVFATLSDDDAPGERFIGQVDDSLAGSIKELIDDVLNGGQIVDSKGSRVVLPEDIGVVVAHRTQESAVKRKIAGTYPEISVDTSERWQGLERDVMIVWHPVSGQPDLTEFAKDAGRLCVMLSRHRAACVVVARESTVNLVRSAGTGKERSITDLDLGWERSRAHRLFLDYVGAGINLPLPV